MLPGTKLDSGAAWYARQMSFLELSLSPGREGVQRLPRVAGDGRAPPGHRRGRGRSLQKDARQPLM